MMKILVTGANGQLGRELVLSMESAGYEVTGLDKNELDITDYSQCLDTLMRVNPDVVIHCAAYTAVDKAEVDQDNAYLVNTVGTRNMVLAAESMNSKFCYISTDYVFKGNSNDPYNEYDNTDPQSVYGKSKRAGELLVQNLSNRFFIVRTAWVYGQYGNNFVKTMLKLAAEKNQLTVVSDQTGSPTYTADLARFLLELVNTDLYGIYHATNSGACSWYEFALAIFEEVGISIQVDPCSTEAFPRPAPRPKNSVLEHMSIRTNGFQDLRHWREGLKDFLRKYHVN
jgi:dTDP-4-dehydrorhamnose reductase